MSYTIRKIFSARNMQRALAQFGNISIQYFFLCALIGIFLVFFVTLVCKLLERKIRLSNVLAGVVWSVYLSVILQLTLVCRENGSRIGIDLSLFRGFVGPDKDFHWLMLAYVVLNFLLFIPYGFALSLFSFINEKKPGIQFILVLMISFATSMLIEITQLVTQRGYYELQDLFFNTLGGAAGWGVFVILYWLVGILLRKREE